MENASKALIIAAAVIISILLVGFAMIGINQGRDSMGNADLSPQEIASHNSQFEAYASKQKGANIRALLNLIAKNNEDYDDRLISVTFTPTSNGGTAISSQTAPATIRASMSGLKTTSSYSVTFTYDGHGGVINSCTIVPYTTGS